MPDRTAGFQHTNPAKMKAAVCILALAACLAVAAQAQNFDRAPTPTRTLASLSAPLELVACFLAESYAHLLPVSWCRKSRQSLPRLRVPVLCLTRLLVLAASSCPGQGQQLKDGALSLYLARVFSRTHHLCLPKHTLWRCPRWRYLCLSAMSWSESKLLRMPHQH